MTRIHSEIPGIFSNKEMRCSDQKNFKSMLPAMEDEELNASNELGKAKKLAKMKNAMTMAYATQCLSSAAMLNAIFMFKLKQAG